MSSIDIIIPCYRYGHFLKECVMSVLMQTGVKVRILIIDDASPDDTPEICSELTAQDTRIEVNRHRVNRGHIETYNEGLEWANADFTLLLSADDLLVPGALQRAVRLLATHPEVGMTYGKEVVFKSASFLPAVPMITGEEYNVIASRDFLEQFCTFACNFVPTPTVVVRTEVQKRLGGYRKELPHSGDMEMWLRFGAHAPVGFINRYQAYTRLHSENMRSSHTGIRDFQQIHAAFDIFFKGLHSQPIDNGLTNVAYQNLANRMVLGAEHATYSRNWPECDELLKYAASIWPEVVRHKKWRHISLKQKGKNLLSFVDKIRTIISIRRTPSSSG